MLHVDALSSWAEGVSKGLRRAPFTGPLKSVQTGPLASVVTPILATVMVPYS